MKTSFLLLQKFYQNGYSQLINHEGLQWLKIQFKYDIIKIADFVTADQKAWNYKIAFENIINQLWSTASKKMPEMINDIMFAWTPRDRFLSFNVKTFIHVFIYLSTWLS